MITDKNVFDSLYIRGHWQQIGLDKYVHHNIITSRTVNNITDFPFLFQTKRLPYPSKQFLPLLFETQLDRVSKAELERQRQKTIIRSGKHLVWKSKTKSQINFNILFRFFHIIYCKIYSLSTLRSTAFIYLMFRNRFEG